jgi:AcrR family transcriptional regulator
VEQLDSIWLRPPRNRRGPDPAYSREQITVAAIKIADADGLQAISMRRVAREVDAGAMSLYRYVSSKDDLFELMLDAVQGEYAPPEKPSGDWRADLTELAVAQRAAVHRHPWLVSLTGRPSFGPNTIRAMEYALSCVDGLGFTIDKMLSVVLSVISFVRGFTQAELAEAEARRRTGLTEEQWRLSQAPYVMHIMESGEFPLMSRVIIEAELPHMDIERQFSTGLDNLLDGVSAQLDRRP